MFLIDAILTRERATIVNIIASKLHEKLEKTKAEMIIEAFKPLPKRHKKIKPKTVSQIQKSSFEKKKYKKVTGFKIIKGRARRLTSLEKFHRSNRKYSKISAQLHQRRMQQRHNIKKQKETVLGRGLGV